MILRWKNRRCVFLDDADRCTAYAYRPLVCRSHPFEVTLTGEDTGGIEDIKLMKLTPCPTSWMAITRGARSVCSSACTGGRARATSIS